MIALIARLAVVAALVAAPLAAAGADPLRLTIPNVHAGFSHVFIAADKGYFQAEGIEVEISVVGGGTATPALIGGSIHYSASPGSSISAILKGAPLRVVLATGTKPIYELWSFDPKVRTLEELKGQQVAIMTRGGTDEIGLRMLLKARNLPMDYVGFSALGREGRMAALIAGAQKISLVGRLEKAQLAKAGLIDKGHMIYDLAEGVQLASGGLVTHEREVTTNRERTKRMLRALWKGRLYMLAETDGTIEVMLKRLPKVPKETHLSDLTAAREENNPTGILPLDAAAKELAVRGELLNIAADKVLPPEKVYDFSLIEEIAREIKDWKPSP